MEVWVTWKTFRLRAHFVSLVRSFKLLLLVYLEAVRWRVVAAPFDQHMTSANCCYSFFVWTRPARGQAARYSRVLLLCLHRV